MKRNLVITGALAGCVALLVSIVVNLSSHRFPATPASSPAAGRELADASAAHLAHATEQIEQLQRSLLALKSQLAAQQSASKEIASGQQQPSVKESSSRENVEARRAADAELYREYMAGAAQSFNNEKVDPSWATQTSSRVSATLASDDELKRYRPRVECRSRTCRVEIQDDGTGIVPTRMPHIAGAVADLFPSIAAEHIDQGNGQRMVALYLYSQPFTATASVRK